MDFDHPPQPTAESEASQRPKRVIVFCFEHLPACSLGYYGEWNISTPEFDALATRSLVCEHYYASSDRASLPSLLAKKLPNVGLVHFEQLTAEDSQLFEHRHLQLVVGELPSPEALTEFVRQIESPDGAILCIRIPSKTQEASELVAAADRWLGDQSDEFQQQIMVQDESGRSKIDSAQLSNALAALSDWQQQLIPHTAQVHACDATLSEWLELCEELLQADDVIVLTSVSGDERRIHDDRPAWQKSVSEPVVHLPLIFHHVEEDVHRRIDEFVDSDRVVQRIIDSLTQETEAWRNWPQFSEEDEIRYSSQHAKAVRTRDWLLIEAIPGAGPVEEETADESSQRLFRKPEDVWEVHDLSSQWPDLMDSYRERGTLLMQPGGDTDRAS